MRRTYLALLLLSMLTHLAAQTHPSAGFSGRIPWCARVFSPQQIGGEMVYPVANGVSAPVLVKRTKLVCLPIRQISKARQSSAELLLRMDGFVPRSWIALSATGWMKSP